MNRAPQNPDKAPRSPIPEKLLAAGAVALAATTLAVFADRVIGSGIDRLANSSQTNGAEVDKAQAAAHQAQLANEMRTTPQVLTGDANRDHLPPVQ